MEGRVLTEGSGIRSSARSGDTDDKDICGKATGNSGGVGGHPACFLCVYTRGKVGRKGETPVAIVESEGSRGPDEGNGGSDFGRKKGAEETGIRQE